MTDENRFEQGRAHFDAQEYFDAHEVWEELWTEQSAGPRHAYLQGLIQVAVALHHAGNANWNGTRKLLASSLAYLQKGETAAKEVDIEKLRDHMLDFELVLQRILAGETVELPFFKLPMK